MNSWKDGTLAGKVRRDEFSLFNSSDAHACAGNVRNTLLTFRSIVLDVRRAYVFMLRLCPAALF